MLHDFERNLLTNLEWIQYHENEMMLIECQLFGIFEDKLGFRKVVKNRIEVYLNSHIVWILDNSNGQYDVH